MLRTLTQRLQPATSRGLAKSATVAASRKLIKTEDFRELGVGGQHKVLAELRRRVLRSRSLPPAAFAALGLRHVKGVLLHGPPGTGKTLLARQLAKLLDARPPKMVNGPEIFRSWVGESEHEIRELFKAAREEHRRLGARAALHIVIFDEIDAICHTRSGGEKSNSAVYDSVVSQVLTMLDGLHDCNNVLVVGITNRPELLDPALLRPGRLEVHLEVGLPTAEERLEVLQLKCTQLESSGWLEANLGAVAAQTNQCSGAEIESIVLNATSLAIDELEDPEAAMANGELKVTDAHFSAAVSACVPANGGNGAQWKSGCAEQWRAVNPTVEGAVHELREQLCHPDEKPHTRSWLFEADSRGCGTTEAIKQAVSAAESIDVMDSIRAATMSEREIAVWLHKSLSGPGAPVVLDSLEAMLRMDTATGSCSIQNLELLKELLWRHHRGPNRVVIASTSQLRSLEQLDLPSCFERRVLLPEVTEQQAEDLFSPTERSIAWHKLWANIAPTRGDRSMPIGHLTRSTS